MTAEEIKTIKAKYGIKNQDIADECCVTLNTVNRWTAGIKDCLAGSEKLLKLYRDRLQKEFKTN